MTVPFHLSSTSSSLWVMTDFISLALRTSIFGSRLVLCGFTFRPEESVKPLSAGVDASSGTGMQPLLGTSRRGGGRCHPMQVTAAVEQAGAWGSPSAPLPYSREEPLLTSRWAEATGTHTAAAGEVQEPKRGPPLKDILPYSGKASAGWMCKPAPGDVFY